MVFSRTLNITSKDAKQPFNLLIFTKPTSTTGMYQLYQDLFPVAWRVISFGDSAAEESTTDFTLNLSAFVGKRGRENFVKANTSMDISEGQTVSLVSMAAGSGVDVDAPATFNEPTGAPVPGGNITIENNTGLSQNIGLMIDGKPAVYYNNVDNENQVVVRIEPKIYLAVNQAYEETEIIKAQIKSKYVTEIDLSEILKQNVDISVGRDGTNGAWKITYQ